MKFFFEYIHAVYLYRELDFERLQTALNSTLGTELIFFAFLLMATARHRKSNFRVCAKYEHSAREKRKKRTKIFSSVSKC